MNERSASYEILTLGQRGQHLLFFLAFGLSFLSGVALPASGYFIFFVKPPDFWETLPWWHALFGFMTATVLVGHLLYLAARSYIEGIPPASFPLLIGFEDLRNLVSEAAALFLGRPGKEARYSPWRKLLYWIFLAGGAAVIASGMALRYWDRWNIAFITLNLDALGAVHGGGAFLLAVLVLWHVDGVLDGGRRLFLLKTVFTGRIGEDDFRNFYPREYLARKEMEERAREKWASMDRNVQKEREATEERKLVEEMLQRGNRLARDGKLPEAIAEYRAALEKFPSYSQAQYNLALVLEKAGRRREALASYRKFLETDQFHPLSEKVREAIARLQG